MHDVGGRHGFPARCPPARAFICQPPPDGAPVMKMMSPQQHGARHGCGVHVGRLPIEFDPAVGFAGHKAALATGFPDIRDAAPGVSLTLAKVLRKACAVDPKDRYTTVAEFDDALSRVREVSGPRSGPGGGSSRGWLPSQAGRRQGRRRA